jgi:5-methylcytosine-specific restriction endonuclease McrA
MDSYTSLLPDFYFEFTKKPSLNTIFPDGNVRLAFPEEERKYKEWENIKVYPIYENPLPQYIDIVNKFKNMNSKEKIEYLTNYDILVDDKYGFWHRKIQKPTSYKYFDFLNDNKDKNDLLNKLKSSIIVKPKKKRSLTEAQKKKIVAKQGYKCANKNSTIKGLDGYQCPLWKSNDGTFDESGYQIDHIIELADNGEDTIDNCQALCLSCHRVKTTRFTTKK